MKMRKRNSWLWIGLLAAFFAGMGAQSAQASSWPKGYNDIVLRRGDKGSDSRFRVVALQYLLRAQGYAVAVDGNFGAQTEVSVKKFQRRSGLKATGAIHNATWAALTPNLKRGSRGNAVRALQTLINRMIQEHGEASDRPIRVDGDFGAATQRWVRQAQRSSDHAASGAVDGVTWFTLLFDEH